MAVSSGVAKLVVIKKESAWGAEGASITARTGAQYLRRVKSDISLVKDTYESNEIRSDFQVADFRHGVRRAEGSIEGELSPETYKLLFAALTRKAFAAGGSGSGKAITIASGTGALKTLTSTNWVSEGFRVGDVIRITAASSGSTDQLNVNLLIVSLTATVATVLPLNGISIANASLAGAAASTTGWKTFVPASIHTDDSFNIEHYHSDIAVSELFSGMKIVSCDIDLPPTGMSTIKFGFMGKDLLDTTARRNAVDQATAYFTPVTAAPTTSVVGAVSGAMSVAGVPVALLTGLSIKIETGMSAEPVVGSNVYPDIVEGRVRVSGQATVMFESITMRDYFAAETEVEICTAFAAGSVGNSEVIAIHLPRVKFGGASKDDGEKTLIMTMPFTALLGTGTGSGGVANNSDATTIGFQDSRVTS